MARKKAFRIRGGATSKLTFVPKAIKIVPRESSPERKCSRSSGRVPGVEQWDPTPSTSVPSSQFLELYLVKVELIDLVINNSI